MYNAWITLVNVSLILVNTRSLFGNLGKIPKDRTSIRKTLTSVIQVLYKFYTSIRKTLVFGELYSDNEALARL